MIPQEADKVMDDSWELLIKETPWRISQELLCFLQKSSVIYIDNVDLPVFSNNVPSYNLDNEVTLIK